MPTAGNQERAAKTLLCFLICLSTPTLELLSSTGRGIIILSQFGILDFIVWRPRDAWSHSATTKRPVAPNLNQRGTVFGEIIHSGRRVNFF